VDVGVSVAQVVALLSPVKELPLSVVVLVS
jgi:hypothetical protein